MRVEKPIEKPLCSFCYNSPDGSPTFAKYLWKNPSKIRPEKTLFVCLICSVYFVPDGGELVEL